MHQLFSLVIVITAMWSAHVTVYEIEWKAKAEKNGKERKKNIETGQPGRTKRDEKLLFLSDQVYICTLNAQMRIIKLCRLLYPPPNHSSKAFKPFGVFCTSKCIPIFHHRLSIHCANVILKAFCLSPSLSIALRSRNRHIQHSFVSQKLLLSVPLTT